MLLAEALNERSDAQRRLADLTQRIGENARVAAGQRPAEDPQALLDQALDLNERVRTLIVAVNVTNTTIKLPDGSTATEALARRGALSQHIRLLTHAADHARGERSGWDRDVAMLDVAGPARRG